MEDSLRAMDGREPAPAALLAPLLARRQPAWRDLLATARYDETRAALGRIDQGNS